MWIDRTLLAVAMVLSLVCGAAPAYADDAPATERLQVAAPYLELRTGPGRGYPVFFVAERDQWISVELRRTDWYRVRADRGAAGSVTGWVTRAQLESTLTAAGTGKTFRDVLIDDYLARRLELGASFGRFEREPLLTVWTAWRLAETLAIEGSAGQVQGLYAGSSFWQVGLSSEPWADQRLSPSFGVGVGRFKNAPNLSLVAATPTDATLAQVSLGVRWYFSRRFVGRVDLVRTTAFLSDERNGEYRSLTAGLSFFF